MQRPLWASTSTKNPAYRDVMYVEELIGPHTVNTMPLETLEAFRDHGEVRGDTVLEGVDAAEQLLADLAEAGVDYDDVVAKLETEGVQKFADSFDELIAGHRGQAGRAGRPDDDRAAELVARIWSRDPTVWTGKDEARWLGWLDEPFRMRDDAEPLLDLARGRVGELRRRSCCSGWAAPRSRPRCCGSRSASSASTCSTRRTRRRSASSRRSSTSGARSSSRASKSGSTLETRSHTDYFWKLAPRGEQWAAITDPGSTLAALAQRAQVRRASSRASRRSAAATRRSRRSGSFRPR